jgi:N-acyl homoserine lactone hydrolase
MYELHSLVDGFPGKSSSHGAFGWSSLWLLQHQDRRVLIDAGPPAYMPLIHAGLAEHGLDTGDITDVVVTHLHWDHVGNFTMYPNATTWVGEEELAWAATQRAGTAFIPDLHVQELLRRREGVERMRDGQELLPGITAIASPGHTPGHLAFHVETMDRSHIFAGDAVKNVFELNTLDVDSTMDAEASRASVDLLRSLLRDTGGVLVPGHDVALALDGADAVRMTPQSSTIGFFADGVRGEVDRSIR